jgi:hemerythrin-like metal-binding protein
MSEKSVAVTEGRQLDDLVVSVPILILQHSAWVSRVRAVMDGSLKMRATEIGDHHACDLGKWFDKHGQEAIKDPGLYQNFNQAHENLHQTARLIVQSVEQGATEEAENTFPQLVGYSQSIIRMIGQLTGSLGSSRQELLSWDKRFEIGHAHIDSQHKELVRLINALYEGLVLGRGKTVTNEILLRLIEYTQTHFRDEERIFSATTYPNTQAHLKEHHDLEAKVTELMANLKSGSAVLGSDTLTFLKNWLTNHILGTDHGYKPYLK